MPGAPPKVEHVKQNFLTQTKSARVLVAAVRALPSKVRSGPAVGIHPKHVQKVVELAFMGVVSAWEEFLEDSLVRYVAGAKSTSGYSPTPKYGQAQSIGHAYELLAQDAHYDPNKNYLKVSDPRWVSRTADFFFHPHPYGCLSQHVDLLQRASSIRNRVAHSSVKCRHEFNLTAEHFMHFPNGVLSQGFGPGALLLKPVQRHFGQAANQTGQTHLEAYLTLFESLAGVIVP